LTSVSGF